MSVEHWENYYRSGQLATCPTGPDGGYDLELRSVWLEFLSHMPAGARILDVATGNGAIIALAREADEMLGRGWELHATDLARIDPRRHVADGERRFQGVHFHPGVATESLPFGSDIDAVCGQYALEYSDMPVALAELARVLRSGGRAQFIVHHADSVLMRNARASLAECEQVLGEWAVFRRLEQCLTADASDAPARQAAANDLQDLARTLKSHVAAPDHPGGGLILRAVLDSVHQLLMVRGKTDGKTIVAEIRLAEGEVLASRQRLLDLVGRAQSEDGIAAIREAAAAAGLDSSEARAQFHAGTNLVGWRLNFSRRAAA